MTVTAAPQRLSTITVTTVTAAVTIDSPLNNAVLNGRMVEQPVPISGTASMDPLPPNPSIPVKVQLANLPPQTVQATPPDPSSEPAWSTTAVIPPITGQLSISASFTYGGSATTP